MCPTTSRSRWRWLSYILWGPSSCKGARAGDSSLPDPRTHQGPHTFALPPGDPESQINCQGIPQIFNEKGSGEIVHEEKRVRESDGKEVKTLKINSLSLSFLKVNTLLKNNIEGIILKWSYQVSTASPFSNGMNNNNKWSKQIIDCLFLRLRRSWARILRKISTKGWTQARWLRSSSGRQRWGSGQRDYLLSFGN